jgi:hypothetical protein
MVLQLALVVLSVLLLSLRHLQHRRRQKHRGWLQKRALARCHDLRIQQQQRQQQHGYALLVWLGWS